MDLKEEIKSSIKLSDLIKKNIVLKQRDKSNFIGLCPFHKEKTPSFNISDDKGFYHCFGCGKNGDIFNYVMEMENIGFLDALKMLAALAGIDYSNTNFKPDPKTTNLFNLLKRVSDSYIQNLHAPIGERAREYLNQRDIEASIIKSFLIGYSGNSKSNKFLVSCLIKEGFLLEDIINVGLAKKNKNNDLVFYFNQRIMFPILNNSGKVIAFGGRLLGLGNPKYLNSPETPLFHKGKQLFGVFNAKKLLNKKRFIICEGYMDSISLTKHGYPSLASLGTSMTERQIDNIFNITDEAFLVFDGDAAGKNATLRVFEKYLPMLKVNKKLKFVFLPENLDPEDYIKKFGVNEFENILNKAIGIIDLIWMEGLKLVQKNEPETNVIFWNYIREKVNSIKDNNIKLAFRDEIEKRIKVYRNKSSFTFKNTSNRNQTNPYLLYRKSELPKTGVEIKIGAVIYMMLLYPILCLTYDENISLLDFKKVDLNKLKDLILKSVSNNSEISSENLIQVVINKGFAIQITKFMRSNYSSRLNLDEKNINFENVNKTFKELLNLINSNAV
ncbi:DNA primase [Alphaproteobacteria bacterium]|nr:DNA primase [Alphaproteobacteria bacterium]